MTDQKAPKPSMTTTFRYPTRDIAEAVDRERLKAAKSGVKIVIDGLRWKCDGCDREFPVNAPPNAPLAGVFDAVREILTEQGWRCGDPDDFCPECVERMDNESEGPDPAG